jgi:hypothetical protein
MTSQDRRTSLFRGEAYEYHFREQESRGVLNTSIRRPWSIALASTVLLCAALSYTLVARVEVVYRAEGAMKLNPVQDGLRNERRAIAYVQGEPDLSVKPGARVRLELLRPTSGGSRFMDGRLVASAQAPTRVEIALDRPLNRQAIADAGASIPIRIHAVECRQSLWRWVLSTSPGCLEQ